MPDKVIEVPGVGNVSFPDSMSDDQIATAIKGHGATSQAEKPGFGTGLYESTVGPIVALGKGLVDNPGETLSGLAKGLHQAILADPMKYAGKTGEAMLHGDLLGIIRNAPGMIPLVGPAAEAVTETAERGEYGRAAGQAAGLLGSAAVPEAMVRGGAALPAVAPALKASAAENYRSVLLPTKRAVTRAEQTAAQLAEEKPIALTRGGLQEQAEAAKAAVGPKAGAAYVNKPPISPTAIFDDIEKMRTKNATLPGPSGPVVVNEPLSAALDKLKSNLTAMQDSMGNIPAKVLDDWRDMLFRGQVDSTGNLRAVNPATAKSVERGLAKSIKAVLDQQFPDAKVINDTYKLWANTADFLEDARRAEIGSKRSLAVGGQQGAGALIQRMLPRPVRQIPTNIAGFFDSVAWNTMSGALKSSVADAMAGGNWKTVEALLKGPGRAATAANAAVGLQPATATRQ